FPRILIFPRRSPPPMPLSTSPIKVVHEPPENNNIRRSPTPSTPHRLTISPPSPGAALPHSPSLLRPVKFGHEPPENNNIRRFLALCLLHHPFLMKRDTLCHLCLIPTAPNILKKLMSI
ncbi:hypothetical protein AABB24_012496, partial [Solanum stoloniferum]